MFSSLSGTKSAGTTIFAAFCLSPACLSLSVCVCPCAAEICSVKVIADAMYTWARELGAIDFAHWRLARRRDHSLRNIVIGVRLIAADCGCVIVLYFDHI